MAMDASERAVLENIIMNLKDYKECPRREQLEHKIMITETLLSALLREDEKKREAS